MKPLISVAPPYFRSLDAFRGIAAIAVVVFHWQMFFYPDDVFEAGGGLNTALPFYSVLSIFYTHGTSVDIFFQISGFIFFWLYADSITSGKTTFRKFSIYRISRLYPLHLATLVTIGILQVIMLDRTGHYFVVQYNDTYHFFLNLFFIQNWGFEEGLSFNAPSWSTSVEIFLYLVFFLICKMKWHTNKVLLLLMIPLGALMQHFSLLTGKGVFSFFLGAMLYYIYVYFLQQNKTRQYFRILGPATLLLWVFVIVAHYYSFLQPAWDHTVSRFRPNLNAEQSAAAYTSVRNLIFRLTVAPCTILSLVLWETVRGQFHPRWTILGKCSYAIYLLHFPLQLIVVLIMREWHLNRQLLLSPWALITFISGLVLLSLVVYYYFERPIQNKIRQSSLSRQGILTQ
ncbi:acyltransferase family protein [Chitinophaga qingshengii]|uniref:Acyltransferase n=1 Tax=Chitinophaga qingshengii TaxID=1569794 RepID=A0ABR7TG67_9BACT|nr:acyltransferase [Chitinophaga qingshengii]MBC9929406.1 acyltransferase [Chitinophaga qingshengii]